MCRHSPLISLVCYGTVSPWLPQWCITIHHLSLWSALVLYHPGCCSSYLVPASAEHPSSSYNIVSMSANVTLSFKSDKSLSLFSKIFISMHAHAIRCTTSQMPFSNSHVLYISFHHLPKYLFVPLVYLFPSYITISPIYFHPSCISLSLIVSPLHNFSVYYLSHIPYLCLPLHLFPNINYFSGLLSPI